LLAEDDSVLNDADALGHQVDVLPAQTRELVAPIEADTPGTLAAKDIYDTQNALPPRFQPRAQRCANLTTYNTVRQLETTNGAKVFPELNTNPPMLLGRAANELSNMSAADYVAVYGDFVAGMVIVDRFPSQVELIPNLFGSNRRPTGQRGAYLWALTGSDVVVPQAFRLLSLGEAS
jgi:HK97 family phage major capsid protein